MWETIENILKKERNWDREQWQQQYHFAWFRGQLQNVEQLILPCSIHCQWFLWPSRKLFYWVKELQSEGKNKQISFEQNCNQIFIIIQSVVQLDWHEYCNDWLVLIHMGQEPRDIPNQGHSWRKWSYCTNSKWAPL